VKKVRKTSTGSSDLRRKAEARLRAAGMKGALARTRADSLLLVHELQVHQLELEMQNEELRRSRAEVEAGLQRYTELYDFAPVGYVTLGRDGAIRQMNLTGARLLGVERGLLQGRRFGVFVAEQDRSVFNAFLENVFASQAKAACEVALLTEGQGPLPVHITATRAQGGQECRAMMADISERKQVEAKITHMASFPMLNPRPIVEVDAAGRVHFCNPVARQMFPDLGLRGPGHPWFADWESVMRSLREGRPRSIVREVQINEKWYHQTMHLVADGNRVRIYGADITARKQADDALRKANAELEQKVSDRTSELAVKINELRLANEELKSRTTQLARLAAELSLAEQRERKRLSQLLHDGLQQHLLSAKILLGGVTQLIGDVGLKQATADIEKIIGESVQLSRSLSHSLSPPILHEHGLSMGLEWLVRWMRDKHNFEVDLSIETHPELPEDVRILVFESVRELLVNAVKHSHVGSARVSLDQVNEAELRIAVSDAGTGFDPRRLKPPGAEGGFGLFSVRERIGLIGGRFEIDSSPSRGSRFILTVPHSVSGR
jgi:PAS domain S-box-containing protein